MSQHDDWRGWAFKQQEVLDLKHKIDWAQNIEGEDVETRWAGKVGETGMKNFMDEKQLVYQDFSTQKRYIDFIINNKKIDLKTMYVHCFPRTNYWVNVNFSQNTNNNEAEFYAFAYFVEPSCFVSFLGFMPKHQFEKQALTRQKGDRLPSGTICRSEMLTIEIEYLEPIYKLWS